MLGDFGEVYVLDWGLARVLDLDEPDDVGEVGSGTDSTDATTLTGSMLGTLGYMPPEQIEDASSSDTAVDSYALGAILFEILAGEPAHPRDRVLESTLAGVQDSPAMRRPDRDVPPELDAICLRALATRPGEGPSAREIADAIQSFLDGDRDLAMRRGLAAAEHQSALDAVARQDRAAAMRAAARAVALDPRSEAADLVVRLVLEPPPDPPPALLAEIATHDDRVTASHARLSVLAYLAWFAFLPLALWNGVTSWPLFGMIYALAATLGAISLGLVHRPRWLQRHVYLYALVHAALLFLSTRLFGLLFFAPVLACAVCTTIVTYPMIVGRERGVLGLVIGGALAPIALELAGILPTTLRVTPEGLISISGVFELAGALTLAFAIVTTIGCLIVVALWSTSFARSGHSARRQLLQQRWQLAQLLPGH
jgi:eukaryotic-like serine/threonine-protein kinase